MSETTMVLLTGLIGTVMVTGLLALAVGGAWMMGRARGRREAAGSSPESELPDERVVRLERLVEQLALEITRLAEPSRSGVSLPPATPPSRAPERHPSR